MSQQEASAPHSPAHGVNLGVRTAGKEVGCSEGPCLWGPCVGSDSLRGGEDGRSVMSWASPGTPLQQRPWEHTASREGVPKAGEDGGTGGQQQDQNLRPGQGEGTAGMLRC